MLLKARELRELKERKKTENESLNFVTLTVGDATNYPKKYDSLAV